jgi:carbamoyl-phosphate synthase small subunit
MKYTTRQSAILLLSDSTIFHGKSIESVGRLLEKYALIQNDRLSGNLYRSSYFGQLMVATNAHIGNYGVNKK